MGYSIPLHPGSFAKDGNNQADRLPDDIPQTLVPIPILNGHEDFHLWDSRVKRVLDAFGLISMIDTEVPRPPSYALNHSKWDSVTEQIARWLLGTLSSSILEEVNDISETTDLEYADTLYNTIKELMIRYGQIMAPNLYKKALRMRRIQYETFEEYVEAFLSAVTESNRVNCTITPYCATLLLLEELKEDLPTWVYMVQRRLPEDAATSLTHKMFSEYCHDAIAGERWR